jgi:GNAT superfamily N-acetyltransferase
VEDAGAPIGYAQAGACSLPHAAVTPGCGELKRIYLVRDRQSGGLGRALFGATMAWLQAGGPRDVWIGVWSENHKALRFYDRQGFAKAGEYGFRVGRVVDREFILRRPAESFAAEASQLAARGHNSA